MKRTKASMEKEIIELRNMVLRLKIICKTFLNDYQEEYLLPDENSSLSRILAIKKTVKIAEEMLGLDDEE